MASVNIIYSEEPLSTDNTNTQTTTIEVAENETLLEKVNEVLGAVFYKEVE